MPFIMEMTHLLQRFVAGRPSIQFSYGMVATTNNNSGRVVVAILAGMLLRL
jgi:hypothetical protein